MGRLVSLAITVGTLVVALVLVLAIGAGVGAVLYLLKPVYKYIAAAVLLGMIAAGLYVMGRLLVAWLRGKL
jgi:hypothetical protein